MEYILHRFTKSRMKRHFFKRHQGRGSYDLFSSYSHFLPGFGGMMMLLLMFLLGALLGNLTLAGFGLIFGESMTADYGTIISYPIMFIPPLLYASVRSRLNENSTEAVALDSNNFGNLGGIKLGLICTIATIAAALAIEPITTLLPDMPAWLKEIMDKMLDGVPLWVTLLSVSIFAPLFEEWLCRGLVLRGLLRSMRPGSAIAVSAVFFAVLHANPWQAIPAFCLGLLFGYVYYRTGSLKLTMLMHCVNNTMAATLSKIPQFKDAETLMDILSPWAYAGVYTCCILILISSIIILKNIPRAQISQNMSDM